MFGTQKSDSTQPLGGGILSIYLKSKICGNFFNYRVFILLHQRYYVKLNQDIYSFSLGHI
jgi:hypothetical protein